MHGFLSPFVAAGTPAQGSPELTAAGDGCFRLSRRLCCWAGAGGGVLACRSCVLVKPQFEAGAGTSARGIVRDPAAHQLAVDKVAECVRLLGGSGGDDSLADHGSGGEQGISALCAVRQSLNPVPHPAAKPESVTLDPMVRVAIVSKPNKDELSRLLPDLIAWLRQHGFDPMLDREGGAYTDAAPAADRAEMPAWKPELVIVLGGMGRCWPRRACLLPQTRRF